MVVFSSVVSRLQKPLLLSLSYLILTSIAYANDDSQEQKLRDGLISATLRGCFQARMEWKTDEVPLKSGESLLNREDLRATNSSEHILRKQRQQPAI